ncbi:MAG: hypothetical protein ABI585_14225 [Betaproteobacteria bacterium]
MKVYVGIPDLVCEDGLGSNCPSSWPRFARFARTATRCLSARWTRAFGVAAPIFGADRRVVGSISVVRAASDIDPTRFAKDSKAVMNIAARLSPPHITGA